jgi:hypothetical protein
MIIAYCSGFDLLSCHYHELISDQTKLVLFFLASQHDRGILTDIVSLSADIDSLTGPSCVAIAFMPPEQNNLQYLRRQHDFHIRQPLYLRNWRPGMLPFETERSWQEYEQSMTQGAYEVARFFGVPIDELPCLLFLDPHQNQKFALLKLCDKRLSEIYPSLRTLFASWYSEHPQLPRLAELKALVNSRPVRSRSFSLPASTSLARRLDEARWAPTLMSKWVQERMDAALRNEVVPFFSDCLEEALKGATAHAKRLGRGVISALKANPRNLEPLRIFMSQRGITFSIDNMNLSHY